MSLTHIASLCRAKRVRIQAPGDPAGECVVPDTQHSESESTVASPIRPRQPNYPPRQRRPRGKRNARVGKCMNSMCGKTDTCTGRIAKELALHDDLSMCGDDVPALLRDNTGENLPHMFTIVAHPLLFSFAARRADRNEGFCD